VTMTETLVRWGRPALVLAGLAVIGYLCYQIGPAVVWESIRALGWRLVVVVVGPFSLAVILDTLGWAVLLTDRRVPFTVLLRARLAGEAVNLITPTASIGGEPLKAYLIRPYAPLSEGLGSVVVDKTTVVAGQVLLLLGALPLAATRLPILHPLMLVMGAILVGQLVAVGGFVVVQTLGVFGGAGRILGRLGRAPAARYQKGLNAVDGWLARFYRERRGPLLGSTLLHAAAWAAGALEIYLVLLFLDHRASLTDSLVIEAFGSAVKFASFIVPASLGVLDGGYVAIFAALGFGSAAGLSYSLVRRLREVLWAAIGLLWLGTRRDRPWIPADAEGDLAVNAEVGRAE